MEGRGGIADFDSASGRLTYHSAWQGVAMIRFALASLLQMPVHHVDVVNGDIGGSFGQKTFVRSEDVVDLRSPAGSSAGPSSGSRTARRT